MMLTWFEVHWLDVLLHLALDITGGLTLRCVIGMCDHKRHQAIVFIALSIMVSLSTVALIG